MARLIADSAEAQGGRRHQRSADGAGQDIADGYQAQLNAEPPARHQQHRRRARTASAARRAPASIAANQPAVREALAGHESVSLLPQPDGILQVVTVPIAIGLTRREILGTLSVGFLLDDALAEQLKSITGSDVAFGMDGQILASTLPRRDRRRCADACAPSGISRVLARRRGIRRRCRDRSRRRAIGIAGGSPAGRADPAVAHRAAAVAAARSTRGSRVTAVVAVAARDAPQLRRRADDHAAAGGHHRRHARGRRHRRPDAQDRARGTATAGTTRTRGCWRRRSTR